MAKVILISQFPLPYSKIGSWPTLYKNYFSGNHQIDTIVCHEPETRFEGIGYSIVKTDLSSKIIKKLTKKHYQEYIDALEKALHPDEKFIIQVVDNFGIITHLEQFLNDKGLRKNVYIQFFYHGHSPFYLDFPSRGFFSFVDEMVLLTNESYQVHKQFYMVLPTRFSVLHNGIDSKKFHKISTEAKKALREKLGISAKKVFVWCSQDRPKKGLDLVLDVWKRIYPKYKDSALLVVGSERNTILEGVHFVGRVPNDELPQYYQAGDVYLFPTLCQEGFGMSLIEALHCGNYALASAMGGVPEVLEHGKLGKLIDRPHFIGDWIAAVEDYLDGNAKIPEFPSDLYTTEKWNADMDRLISEAKITIE